MNINITLLGQVISFALLICLTRFMIWPKLQGALETREKTIADGLAAAEQGKQSLQQAQTTVAAQLDEAKNSAAQIIEQAEKRAAQIVDDAKGKAQAEGSRIIDSAKSEIAKEVEAAKSVLRAQVADMAIAGAEQILQREVDKRTNRDILDKLATEI